MVLEQGVWGWVGWGASSQEQGNDEGLSACSTHWMLSSLNRVCRVPEHFNSEAGGKTSQGDLVFTSSGADPMVQSWGCRRMPPSLVSFSPLLHPLIVNPSSGSAPAPSSIPSSGHRSPCPGPAWQLDGDGLKSPAQNSGLQAEYPRPMSLAQDNLFCLLFSSQIGQRARHKQGILPDSARWEAGRR